MLKHTNMQYYNDRKHHINCRRSCAQKKPGTVVLNFHFFKAEQTLVWAVQCFLLQLPDDLIIKSTLWWQASLKSFIISLRKVIK